MNETLRLTLFGSPRVLLGDQPLIGFIHHKAKALLFYLAVTGQPHSRDALATLLWNDMSDVQAKNNLRSLLPELRRLVGDYIVIERQTVAFQRTSLYWLDAEVLRRSLTPVRAITDLVARQAAVDLYQGEFLSGFYVNNAPAFDAWLLEQREQLHALVIEAMATLVNEYVQQGDTATAIVTNRRLLGLEPWSESVHRQQMVLLAQTGARAAALAQYEICQRMLMDEFGVEPQAETTVLYQQIRAGGIGGQQNKEPGKEVDWGQTEKGSHSVSAESQQLPQVVSRAEPASSTLHTRLDKHSWPKPIKLYGRQPELARLQKWISEDGCRLVGVFGIGGQGKTALAATLVRTFAESALSSPKKTAEEPPVRFQHILWQSLLNAPPLAEVIQAWLYVLSGQTVASLPTSLDQQLGQLFDYLQRQPCLLVLDNLESILQGDGRGGYYRPGYEGYGQLLHRLVEGEHHSCLLLTSRERPQDLTSLEEDTPAVRWLSLAGLPPDAGCQMIEARGMVGKPADLVTIVQQYSGNPLALRLITETVQELFEGDIATFLRTGTLVFDDIREVLDQQFARLTPLERELMVWLAIVREPIAYTALHDLLAQPPAPRLLLEAMRSLQRRSLLEKYEAGFGLQNVVLEYITDWLVEGICTELADEETRSRGARAYPADAHLNRYALMLAQTKEYIRASQTRVLLQPVADHLLTQLSVWGVEQQLQMRLARLRTAPPAPGYAAANLLHLLLQLGVELRGYDFSQLYLRQVYLRGVSLPQVNLAGAHLSNILFTERLGRIFTVVFSPDGRLLAAGTREGTIHLWRTADQQLIQVIQAHNHAIVDLAFAPAVEPGAPLILASAGEDRIVGLWEITEIGSVQPLSALAGHRHWLDGHRQTVIGVGFRADGQRLTSVDMGGDVRVWESSTGQLAYHFNCSLPKFWVIGFSRDGHKLAIGGNDGVVYVWQVAGVQDLVLAGHTRDVTAIAFSPDGGMLASGGGDGRVCLWALPQGQLQQVLDATAGFVSALAFSPDGQTLASSHWDRAVRLWAVPTTVGHAPAALTYAVKPGQLRHTLVGHTHVIRTVVFSPDGRSLVSGGSDQTVRAWDVQTGHTLYTLRGHYYALSAIALSPDGTKLAGVGYDQLVHLWQRRATYEEAPHRALRGHHGLLHTVAFSPDGSLVASAGRDSEIHLWDVASGQLRATLHGQAPDIYRVAFHPDGRLLASGGADGMIRLWDLHAISGGHNGHSQPAGVIAANGSLIYTIAFSPDGRSLASAGVGPTICLWDMTQAARPELVEARKTVEEVSEQEIVSLAFSADSRRLACGGTNLIHLWDWPNGKTPVILHHHTDWVMALAFSPNGAILASASEDRTVCLWDVARGAVHRVLHGHTEGVSGLVFSADGAYVLSGSADGTIRFWDSQTGDCVNTLFVEGPYADMNITGVTGLTEAQKRALKALGAIEKV